MKILVAIDGSYHSDNAVDSIIKEPWPEITEVRVATVAEPFHRHLDATFGPFGSTVVRAQEALYGDILKLLQETVEKLEQKFGKGKVSRTYLEGQPAEKLLEEAKNWRPDLLVIGSHGMSGYNDQSFGSVTLMVANHAPCSVWIVHYIPSASLEKEQAEHLPLDEEARFLVALEDSPNSKLVVESILSRAWLPESRFQILSVVQEPKSIFHSPIFKDPVIDEAHKKVYAARKQAKEKLVQEVATTLESKIGKGRVTYHVLEGNVRSLILQMAQDWPCDRIIIGAHDRDKTILEYFLGSVAQAIVNNADCSVEIVRRKT